MSKRKEWKPWEFIVLRLYLLIIFFIIETPALETFKLNYIVYSSSTITSEPRDEKELVIQKLIREFIEDAKLRNVHIDSTKLTFSFANDLSASPVINFNKGETLGQCNTHLNHIQVLDNEVLYFLTDNSFKAVLYHELGHCLLGLEHDETALNVPNLMNSVIFEEHEDWVYLNKNNPRTWTLSVDHLFEKYQNHLSQK